MAKKSKADPLTKRSVPGWVKLIGAALRYLRSEREWGVRELAKDIGISQSTISRLERGFPPDVWTLTDICKYFDLCPVCGRRRSGKQQITVTVEAPKNVIVKMKKKQPR